MSDKSPYNSMSSSPRSITMATTVEDTYSIAASIIMPRAPHPTPANTEAGDLPSMAYVADKLAGISTAGAPLGIRGNISTAELSRMSTQETAVSEEYPEANTWAALAEEDLEHALKRLAMAAKDAHKKDASRTVKQHYSERLAKLIKEGEIEFDLNAMN